MPTAEATVATDRASRYLVQRCRHASQVGRHQLNRAPAHASPAQHEIPAKLATEWSESDGPISVAGATCTLRATPDALLLHAEADDDDNLLRLQEMITKNLARFSRREPLVVRWQRVDQPGGTPVQAPHRGRHRTTVLVLAGGLA